jgi:hypothetical protein
MPERQFYSRSLDCRWTGPGGNGGGFQGTRTI